jgi:calcium-translocating P-type ATPase
MFGYFGGAFVAIRALTLGIWDIVNTGDISFGIIAYTVLNAIMMGVSIIVMAVPEGLPLIGGLIQGLNVKNMHKDNIFVRNPKAVETAGYVTRLFVNKTGILTSGDMSVANVIIGSGRTYTRFENLAKTLQEQITIGAGVNNEAIVNPENRAFGSDEIDVALLQYLLDNKVEIDKSEVISSEAFNSIAKFTTITMSDGTKYIKGAPDVVMNDCDNFLDEYGNEQQMNEDVKKKLSRNMRMQKVRAMRVIALAKIFEGKKTIIALISIKNEAREDARNAIARLRRAGITVTMVTGDDLITAVSIAKATGLTGKHSDVCLSHNDLMRMSDDELINVLPNLKVVARAEPEDKERLIRLSHQMDEVVGITGNNVNDVSILNKADVSFAVMSATEFAKGVADIIILNNSLKTIGDVIKYGRTTGKTIKKFIVFQLTVNVSSVITAIIGPFLGSGEVFTIVQMLWINMVMDVLAAMAFAQEPPQEAYMLEKPIPRTADIINTYVKSAVAVCGVLITVICLGILTDVNGIHNLIGSSEESVVKTFMFATFIFLIIMNSLNARTQSLNLFEHITQNRNFILVMSFVAVMQITIIQVLGQIFGTVPLSLHNWICVILISMVIIPVDFIRKIIVKKMGICE